MSAAAARGLVRSGGGFAQLQTFEWIGSVADAKERNDASDVITMLGVVKMALFSIA